MNFNSHSTIYLACAGLIGALLFATLPGSHQVSRSEPIVKVARQVFDPLQSIP